MKKGTEKYYKSIFGIEILCIINIYKKEASCIVVANSLSLLNKITY